MEMITVRHNGSAIFLYETTASEFGLKEGSDLPSALLLQVLASNAAAGIAYIKFQLMTDPALKNTEWAMRGKDGP